MQSWIGPAIIAAVISSLVTVIGWWFNHRHEHRTQVARRQERIRDVQTALRAEIRSHRRRLLLFEQATALKEAVGDGPAFTPFVPSEVRSFLFEAVVTDIPILPVAVIDPVVIYYRQVHALTQFAEDLRADRFASLEWPRKAAMHADYIAMGIYAGTLADEAISAIDAALARAALSSSASDRSVRKSASEPAGPGSDEGSNP
ncbi:hypothetical protein [Bosea sp. 117]|uniref:hypothetical protein n=1 Tax=Bosea sp. 117 TaxID=1125973 RepID=UPI00049428AF|nr:hypothetical protein [Bosea sp. 117]